MEETQQGIQSAEEVSTSGDATQAHALPITFETGKRYRLHSSYIWLAPISTFGTILAAVLFANVPSVIQSMQAIGDAAHSNTGALLILLASTVGGLIGLIALLVGFHYLSWRFIYFSFEVGEFTFHKGIIAKHFVHIPYTRIQSINHHASLIQRLAGVCSVSLDTAGGAANKAVKVPFVTLQTAERIRSEFLARKTATLEHRELDLVYIDPGQASSSLWRSTQAPVMPGSSPKDSQEKMTWKANPLDAAAGELYEFRGMFGGGLHAQEQAAYTRGLTTKELIFAALTHINTLVFTLSSATAVIGFLPFVPIPSDMKWLLFLLVIPVCLFGVVPVILSYGGFTVSRRGNRIEVESGLLQRNFSGVDIERIQQVRIHQSIFRRMLGYCEVVVGRVDVMESASSSRGVSNQEGLVVFPFVKLSEAQSLMRHLLPEFEDIFAQQEIVPVAKHTLRRAIIRGAIWQNFSFWVLAAIIPCLYAWMHFADAIKQDLQGSEETSVFWHLSAEEIHFGFQMSLVALIVICLIITAFCVVGAVMWHRNSGFALSKRSVFIINRGISSNWVVIPREKLQFAAKRVNPFQHVAGVASLQATTAAGFGHTKVVLWDISSESADQWLNWAHPRAGASAVYDTQRSSEISHSE